MKSKNGLEPDSDLVLLKYENENSVSNGNEKSIQFEVYIPNTNTKLDLSICIDKKMDIYIPIELSEKTQKLYDDLKKQNYNLFDETDKFYNDICSQFKSEKGTDILLADRYNYYFIPNQLSCQKNCEYSDYLYNSKYLKCKCNIIEKENIEVLEPEKITAKLITKTFYNVLKYSNYKVLKCYKLVFQNTTIIKNIGSILSIIYFIGFLISFGLFFYYKNIFYLNKEIHKLTLENKNIDKNKSCINRKNTKNDENIHEFIKEENKTNSIKIKMRKKTKRKFANHNNISSRNILKHKFTNKSKELINEKITIKFEHKNNNKTLTDYELNDLDYINALNKDDRNFIRTYWYLLKREHLLIFTFFNKNDYNIFSIKLSKLFLAICSDMAFNVFFFSDESMHNIYISGGVYNYIEHLAQMIYSTIISQILQIFINYLTMTDIHYYKIKNLLKENNLKKKKFKFLIDCIKYKIIIFYSFAFLLFLFFWYLISAFCAVYENTQKVFIIDSISSFIYGLIYPFIFYLIPSCLRIISLKAKEKKNLKCLYFLSDKIPIF